jgi:hypothetical protein
MIISSHAEFSLINSSSIRVSIRKAIVDVSKVHDGRARNNDFGQEKGKWLTVDG